MVFNYCTILIRHKTNRNTEVLLVVIALDLLLGCS